MLATSEGTADLEVTATFVQTTSAAPVDTPVTLRLDPSVVRVRDTAVGQLEAIIDNRGGTRVRRVFLSGRDPERLVRFTFSPPSLDVLPGEIGRVRVRLEAPLPDPGQDATRQITVIAADGTKELEASGTFVQVTSPAPVETPVALKLEPSLVRVRDTTSGAVPGDRRQPAGHPAAPGHAGRHRSRTGPRFLVLATGRRGGPGSDRQGHRPGRRLPAGTRPRGHPAVLGVRLGRRQGGRGGRHLHPVDVTAGPRRADDVATGTEHRPGPQQRHRDRHRLPPTTAADRGTRRVQFGGHDPERVVRFAFNPPVLDLAPGQAGRGAGADLRTASRRRGGGQPAVHVVASDGAGTPRRPAASSRNRPTAGRCGGSC